MDEHNQRAAERAATRPAGQLGGPSGRGRRWFQRLTDLLFAFEVIWLACLVVGVVVALVRTEWVAALASGAFAIALGARVGAYRWHADHDRRT